MPYQICTAVYIYITMLMPSSAIPAYAVCIHVLSSLGPA